MGDGLVRRDQQLGLAETSWYHQKQTAKRERGVFKGVEEKIMTAGFGLGMFAYNMVCLMIGLIIIYYVINNIK